MSFSYCQSPYIRHKIKQITANNASCTEEKKRPAYIFSIPTKLLAIGQITCKGLLVKMARKSKAKPVYATPVCKEALFVLQTSLVCTVNKPCLQHKQALFATRHKADSQAIGISSRHTTTYMALHRQDTLIGLFTIPCPVHPPPTPWLSF